MILALWGKNSQKTVKLYAKLSETLQRRKISSVALFLSLTLHRQSAVKWLDKPTKMLVRTRTLFINKKTKELWQ